MGGTEQDGQGGRPSAGIMTGQRAAVAPLDATLLAVAGGILFAWWLPLPLCLSMRSPSLRHALTQRFWVRSVSEVIWRYD